MNRIRLVLPDMKYKEQMEVYVKEYLETASRIDGGASIEKYESYEMWLRQNALNQDEATVQEGLVPATTFFAVDKYTDQVIGMIDIRHYLNEHLYHVGGHIGYNVHPAYRRQGYAHEMLTLALIECLKFNITQVLITCHADNEASRRTILSCGGVLEDETEYKGEMIQRYWIALD